MTTVCQQGFRKVKIAWKALAGKANSAVPC
jgi:hypothetical protein